MAEDQLTWIYSLAKAASSAAPRDAYREALSDICTSGNPQQLRQFELFMSEARAYHDELQLIVPQSEPDIAEGTLELSLVLTRDGVSSQTAPVPLDSDGEPSADSVVFNDVPPGEYELTLDSGLLLWRRKLSERDLVRRLAFPDATLRAAAATEHEKKPRAASCEAPLFQDTWRLRVLPGYESGAIEIRFR